MKLEAGMYVRINNNFRQVCIGLGKIQNIVENTVYIKMSNNDLPISFLENEISKASHNIIDLIEIRDVIAVDDIKYTVLQNENIFDNKLYIERNSSDNAIRKSTVKHLFNQNKIQEIVTKEQLEKISYTIE